MLTIITFFFDCAHLLNKVFIGFLVNCYMSIMVENINSSQHNTDLARIFHQMASCYRYKGKEERFRAIAYDAASRTLTNLKDDISHYAKDVKSLDKLSGIGESIGEKIIEYLQTGKIKTFEKLKEELPQDLLDMMDINGFGPATIKLLHEKLKINNKDDLIAVIGAGKLERLKGFGAKKIENMKRGLKLFKESHTRMLLWDAMQIGNEILKEVLNIADITKAELAGSLRRKKETIGDIDIIITAEKKNWKKIINKFISIPQCKRILANGETKASILLKNNNVQVDVRIVNDNEYGSALLYFTGSKEHNIELRKWASERGWKMNEYGVFDATTNKRLAGRTEEEIYHLFGLQYIPPELREMRGELEIAKKKKLPELLELSDIKGDMQMHSIWSDGADDIDTIAEYVLKNFPHYEYIVITDHSPSERIAGGLKSAEFKKQFIEIDKLNKKVGKDFVKKGVEVDILSDGSLDLPDDLLQQFDWVVASIHTGFNNDNTYRLLRACEHPYVHCIGHPGGRLIGKREAYPVDWKKFIGKAAETGTAIEINAQPNRLDLRDDLVKEAIENGVMITISTDAHSLNQFDYISLGVDMARRGWCSKKNILNTELWKTIEEFKKKKKASNRDK